MNRPDELSRCLNTVFQNSERPDEVIVSDDSSDGQPVREVVSRYPDVIYQSGPRRGLAPNRNACIQRVKENYIIFIDDDICVPQGFFATVRRLLLSCDSKTLITGYQMEHGNYKLVPNNSDFWGFQSIPVSDKYCAIVINSTIFPRSLFDRALFDENLRYGSEEIDMARHAVALGYRIIYEDCLYVNHYPSPVNREQYKQFVYASRLYATTKAYWYYERSVAKTLAFILLAPLQLLGSAVRRRDLRAVWGAFQSIALAGQYLFSNSKMSNPKQFSLD
jgi:GT2 family glycosyltransferase